MTAFLWILALTLTPSALFLAWMAADTWLARREDDRRREQQGREVTPEPTPVYDALVCEQMERAEGWSA